VVDIDSASAKPAMGHHLREISLLNLMCFDMIPQNVQKFKFFPQINGQHEPLNALLPPGKAYALEHLKIAPFLFLALCVAAIRLAD
jgi:hypothetical protein